MNPNWAEENLQVIRTLMERSAVYRRALSPIMLAIGALGVVAAIVGSCLPLMSTLIFIGYWTGVAILALCAAFFLARRQAVHDKEPFWSGPTIRVAQALFPALFVGLVLTLFLSRARVNPFMFALLWIMLYGCAIHAAGFFMPRGIKWLGWIFILGGTGVLSAVWITHRHLTENCANIIMGVFFGGLHLAYGGYIYFTEKGKNAA